ncbi:TPA: hypothetical protein ACVGN0_004221 [Pseudomonas aeruginosa]|uniref:hypothetical protein n=1 Tax=Pseudomonas aeruginosa TaxID=287 RepID=UPI001043285E|nr:hypothetical protein [Pseudomonas aeruginosa]MCO3568280.1 hypothetical protein [Pseudomonas aeruginosa]MCP9250882.1 hypothetical protein [Pseudomonas aeruginosa]MDN3852899.1 hypothetical protein [Pseudomonas aeruginosa]QII94103.1 hypothetical protein F9C43_11970 [Pseudomonas aeruginosa]WCV63332.1 hypothetical protein KKY59_11525 [Pseudomonas aeruginosa]
MRSLLVLSVVLLAACDRPTCGDLAETLATNPARLKALLTECVADWRAVGEDTCRTVVEAYRRRFFAGHSGPDEYVVLEELPPISPTFDEPGDEVAESGARRVVVKEDAP